MGKEIGLTYIDGELIFGNDPMAALQNLMANDVLKIRVYDEYLDQNQKRKRHKGDDTQRVFNIETKSKLIQATTGHFLTSYGADINQGAEANKERSIFLRPHDLCRYWDGESMVCEQRLH